MRTIERIDEFLNKLNEKSTVGKEFQLLKEDNLEVYKSLVEKAKVGGKEYDDFFKSMLKKWKVKSYKDLPKAKQKKFFDEVDAKWKAKKETD